MVFESNPHGTLGTIIIVSVCLVALFWGATEGAANGATCCSHTDIQLTVECGNGSAHLRWESSRNEEIGFGFDVRYNCNPNATCDRQEPLSYRWSQVHTAVSNVFIKNLTNPDFGNTFCWFSVNAVEDRNNNYGCSPVATCNAVANNTASSVTTSDLIMPSSLSTSSSSTSHVLISSPSMMASSIFLSSSTVSSSLSLTSTTTTTATTTANNNNNTTTTATIAVTATLEMTGSPVIMTTASILHTSPSAMSLVEPQQNTSAPDPYSLLLYITLFCTVIVLVLFSVCLFFCWRKYQRKQSEIYQIEDVCCEDPGELAKESDSETETLTSGNGIGDEISITDDHTYMLQKILHLDILSLDPSIFTNNEVDDGTSHYRTDDGGADCSHYCGSGGQSIQSNTSNHSRSSSCSES